MQKSWRYLIYALILLGYYCWLLLSPALFGLDSQNAPSVTVIGHRGAAGYAPENTLSSIRKAMDLGVDRIEIDIHQTKDNVVVLMHDESVDRTTNGSGKVADLSYKEISSLDAGSSFNAAFKGEKVPTLEEVLQLINGEQELIIEFKNGNESYPGIEENVLALIEQYDAEKWCIVHSFNTGVLERIHEKAAQIRLHKLFILEFRFSPFYFDQGISIFNPDDYPYIEEYSINEYFGNTHIIRKLQSMGKRVNIWTVNDPERIEAFKSMGVDGIISNYPDLIQ